jgi:hypothetical protein
VDAILTAQKEVYMKGLWAAQDDSEILCRVRVREKRLRAHIAVDYGQDQRD